ncbi:EF-hand calcium-binding domain-containing protein 12-like isoform X2 [Littorina saxatilis]|uniref:EF-hand calcium-binding domain-containing protein 12-like isoform X2 n=1 Tax=Littorina saxatilis TaxID=31220 RepID=UPI0038B48C97
MTRRGAKGGTALVDTDIGFDLDRLFDHYNMDHIPKHQRLDQFKQRNLPHVKHYKAAVNIFGGPISRKRVIIAPPMETPLKRKLGLYMNQVQFPQPPVLNSSVNPANEPSRIFSSTEIHDQEEKEKEMKYKKWYAERQALRDNLEGMGLSEAFLQGKADKTELEKRVETRLRAARLFKPEPPPPPEPVPEEKEPPVVPSVKVPVPSALQILDKFLTDKKMRLIDLFRNADTNNDWKLTKSELQAAIKKYDIPLTGSDVEDMMVTLDRNFDEHLDFKELAQGLATLRAERRVIRRQQSASETSGKQTQSSPLDNISPYSRDQMNSNQSRNTMKSNQSREQMGSKNNRDQSNVNQNNYSSSSLSHKGQSDAEQYKVDDVGEIETSLSSTPSSLEPPPPDLREECRQSSSPEEMVALRKHDRTVLERSKSKKWPWTGKKGSCDEMPGVIRIGHLKVDQHCMESTLEGEVGVLMDKFRRNRLKEYFEVIRVCHEKGLVLTPELLDRVLLYPPELPRWECMKKLALPTGPLAGLSEQFAKLPRKPQTPPEIRYKDKMKRSSNGTLMIDVRHMYPPWAKVSPVISKENLSTGRALVSHKLDSWMSFEEYDQYTRHLPRRYKKLSIATTEGGLDHAEIMSYTKMADYNSNMSAVSGIESDKEKVKRYQLDEDKFWPGYMLDKLVLYEPSPDGSPGGWGGGQSAIFHHTGQKKRGNIGKEKFTI